MLICLSLKEITKLNKIAIEYGEDKGYIMLLKCHSDSVENIDDKA